ncbi:MAG: GAF domain-containing protein [Candidatus Wallbacteria bacterium]
MKEQSNKILEILHENELLKKEIEVLKKSNNENEQDVLRNKKGKKMLSLLNHMLEDKISNMTLMNEVIANINTVEDMSMIWQEMRKIIQKVIDYDYAIMLLAEKSSVYFHSKRRVNQDFLTHILNNVKENFKSIEENFDTTHNLTVANFDEKSNSALPLPPKIETLTELISIPLTIKRKNIGMVMLYSHKARQLQEEQINNFFVIVNNVVAIIYNAILYESAMNAHKSLAKNVQSLKRLLDVTKAMSSGQMSYEKLIDYILDMAISEIAGDGGSLMLIDRKEQQLYIKSAKSLPDEAIKKIRIKIGQGTAGEVVESGNPIISVHESFRNKISTKDYQNYKIKYFPPFGDYSERSDVRSGISVPLMTSNEAIGVINVTSSQTVFNEDDLEKLMLFASQATNTITVSQLNLTEKQRINELSKLNEIGKALNSTLNHEEIFRLVMDALSDLIDFSVGTFFIEEDTSNFKLNIISQDNLSRTAIDSVTNIVVNSYVEITKRAIERENIAIDYEVTEAYEQIYSKTPDIKSYLVVPLVIKGQVRGILNVNSTIENAFTEDNMRTLSTFASQVAIAIENSRSYELMERKIKELSMLFEVSRTITSTLDLNNVLELIVSISAQLMDAKVAYLRLLDVDSGELVIKASYGVPDNYFSTRKLKVNEGVSGLVISTKEPVTIFNINDDKLVKDRNYFQSLGLVSILAVPLIVRDTAIGVISCFFKKHHRFSQSEINLLQTLASHAAIALENAKLYGDMQKNYTSTITALSAAIDAKDHYTHGHSKNVMEYAVAIATEMKLSKEEIETIRFAGLLHDIGKIGISEVILQKRGHLTDDEFNIISSHPKLGLSIMNEVGFLKKIAPLTYHHHEKYDGSGYPDHLKGDEIPLGARILNVSDSFDVMTTARVYKTAMSFEDAVKELDRCAGKQFDPKVVSAFKNVIERVKHQAKDSSATIANLVAASNIQENSDSISEMLGKY